MRADRGLPIAVRVKLFTFRYSSTLGGFDETPLAEFTRGKESISLSGRFFAGNDVPNLTCVLIWQDAAISEQNP